MENLNGMATQIGTFDKAVEAPLFYGSAEQKEPVENYKGIYNLGTGKIASVVSKGYQIIQHNDVVNGLVNVLGSLNLDVHGTIRDNRDKLIIDLAFKDQSLIEDDSKGIQLGIRAINSYNKTSSFRLEMYAYRLVCQNGMSFGNVMETREITMHVGKAKTQDMVEKTVAIFVKNVINSSEKLQNLVNKMMVDSIEWNTAVKIFEGLIVQKKHREAILDRLDRTKPLTRWDIYNAMTNYITHDDQLTPNVQTYLETKSQKVLKTDVKHLEKELVVTDNNQLQLEL